MKKNISGIGVLILILFLSSIINAREESSKKLLIPQLKLFESYVGKTWRGSFQGQQDNMQTDISRWERALNGKAVRILHSVDNGVYGGETIIYWDAGKQKIVFYYFTTAGFMTHGSIRQEEGKFISHEVVTGSEEGITEVKAIGELLPDGKMKSSSLYLKKGKWIPGHQIIYQEDPSAKVIFR